MSLMSASLGDSGEIGALTFEGIWNCFACAPSACAFAVNAQSTNRFAWSRLGEGGCGECRRGGDRDEGHSLAQREHGDPSLSSHPMVMPGER